MTTHETHSAMNAVQAAVIAATVMSIATITCVHARDHSTADPPYYALRVITPSSSVDSFTPTSISPSGIITGRMRTGSTHTAFTWHNGAVTQYTAPSWGHTIVPNSLAVNDRGAVVGALESVTKSRPFYADPTVGLIEIDPLGTRYGTAYDISSTGRIVGQARSPLDPEYVVPFVWQNGQGVELPIPLGFESGVASTINDIGVIGGWVTLDREYPAQWDKDGLSILPIPIGHRSARIVSLDNSQRSIGFALSNDAQRTTAMLWRPTFEPVMLSGLGGASSTALAINEQGLIVGSAQRADGTFAATLWINGHAWDLSMHLTLQPDVHVHRAVGIDAYGRIVAIARVGEHDNVAVLLRPVPAPSAGVVAMVCLCGCVARRRR